MSYNTGFKGRFDFSLLQQNPVDLSEERMGLDGLLTALAHHTAQTLGRILSHELHRKRNRKRPLSYFFSILLTKQLQDEVLCINR